MNKIKVLFLIDKLEPAGTQTNLLEIVKHLDRERFEPRVIALVGGGELLAHFNVLGAQPQVLRVKRVYGISGVKALFFLARYMKEEGIDVVQTHFLHADILGSLAARMAGIRKIYTTRRDEGFWRGPRQLWINRFFNRSACGMLVNSQAVKRAVLRSEQFPADKIRVIYNGVDVTRFNPDEAARRQARKKLGLADSDVVVGMVANMRHRVKGYEYLIPAVPEVLKKAPGVKFLFVGDGRYRREYEGLVSRLNAGRQVIFAGARKDIPELINAMDICCLSSLSEGFSNSILEYMAAGKPVVATEVGGNPETVQEGATGFLVPASDSSALAARISRLAADPALRASMGKTARARILNGFTVEKMAREYEKIYSGDAPDSVRRKKILFLIWSLDQGGAEQVVLNLARGLDRGRFEPLIGCLNEKGRYAPLAESDGIRVIALHKKGAVDIGFVKRLVALMREENVDLVHTHLFTANLWGRVAAKLAGVPAVSTEHNIDSWKGWVHFAIDRVLLPVSRRTIYVSEKVREFYAEKVARLNGRARVIYNGIDGNRFRRGASPETLRKALNLDSAAIVIGTIGRLVPQKGHEYFLEALQILSDKHPNVAGLIVGEGETRELLDKRIKELGLEPRVRLTGFRKDVTELYQAMDIFVLSSLREGFPMTLLEAMAVGVPVVSTNVGGVGECITDRRDGLLVPAADSRALARAIATVIEDPALRERLVRAAQEKVRARFLIEKMVEQHERLYQEVLD